MSSLKNCYMLSSKGSDQHTHFENNVLSCSRLTVHLPIAFRPPQLIRIKSTISK